MTGTVAGGPPEGREPGGQELRGRFIIDPDAVIQAAEVLTPPAGRRFAETVRHVQAFQHVRNTEGAEATPAAWTPCAPTPKPGPDLVGSVWKGMEADHGAEPADVGRRRGGVTPARVVAAAVRPSRRSCDPSPRRPVPAGGGSPPARTRERG